MTKKPGDGVFSGSTCKQGEIEAVVIATGVHTFFGKAAHLVDSTNQVGHFQKVCQHTHLELVQIIRGPALLRELPSKLCCMNITSVPQEYICN